MMTTLSPIFITFLPQASHVKNDKSFTVHFWRIVCWKLEKERGKDKIDEDIEKARSFKTFKAVL